MRASHLLVVHSHFSFAQYASWIFNIIFGETAVCSMPLKLNILTSYKLISIIISLPGFHFWWISLAQTSDTLSMFAWYVSRCCSNMLVLNPLSFSEGCQHPFLKTIIIFGQIFLSINTFGTFWCPPLSIARVYELLNLVNVEVPSVVIFIPDFSPGQLAALPLYRSHAFSSTLPWGGMRFQRDFAKLHLDVFSSY